MLLLSYSTENVGKLNACKGMSLMLASRNPYIQGFLESQAGILSLPAYARDQPPLPPAQNNLGCSSWRGGGVVDEQQYYY